MISTKSEINQAIFQIWNKLPWYAQKKLRHQKDAAANATFERQEGDLIIRWSFVGCRNPTVFKIDDLDQAAQIICGIPAFQCLTPHLVDNAFMK